MKITREDVVRVAELAYMDLSEIELETYRRQIDEILEYIGKLNELDTSAVEPMAQVLTGDQTADATMREDWWCLRRGPRRFEPGSRPGAALFPSAKSD